MKTLTQFGITLLTAALLAACGDAGQSASESKPVTVQTAEGEVTVSGKYAEILNTFPEADPKLAEPIAISDQKSPTGLEDLKKVIEFATGAEAQKIGQIGSKLRQSAHNGDEAAALAGIKELSAALEQYTQDADKLDIKDAEVKAVLDRTLQTGQVANRMMIHAAENASLMKIDMKDKDAVAFMKAYQDKSNKLAEILGKGNAEAHKAGEALGKKYSR